MLKLGKLRKHDPRAMPVGAGGRQAGLARVRVAAQLS